MSFKEKWNRMNRKADQAIKNAKARKTAQPDTDNTGRKEKKPGGHKVLRAIAAVCLVGIMLMCVAGCVLTVWAFDTLNTDQQMLDLSMQKAKYTTIFYADDGVTELARAYDPDAGNRIWVDYDQMPKCLLDATVAVEDKRFWEHNGVDFLTTSKAGLSAILQKIGLTGFYGGATPGASTITQQVVRNITNDRAVDGAAGWARKLREIFRALNVEKYYTKTQIIETYFLLTIIEALLKTNADLYILDPKNADLADLGTVMGNVYHTKDDMIDCVNAFYEGMVTRSEEMKLHPNYRTGENYAYLGLAPQFLIFDEYVAFLEMLTTKESTALLSQLKKIVMLGRQAGYFLIVACQRPDAKYFSDGIRDNFNFRVGLGRLSELGYGMLFGSDVKKQFFQKRIKGRGYCDVGTSVISEFYTPSVPKGHDFLQTIGSLAQARQDGTATCEAKGDDTD